MAAKIHANASTDPLSSAATMSTERSINAGKPELINKLEGGADEVNDVSVIADENGIITVSSDRSVRVWLLRDSGQYWPSICHYMGAAATSVAYECESKKLFVGLENGIISEFKVASDYNHIDHVRDYHAHQSRITGMKYSSLNKVLLSVARDKYFQFHCSESGRRFGGYLCSAWCTAVEYDERDQYVFIGDYSGIIVVCKLAGANGVQLINTLKGHSGSIQALNWDGDKGWLYSSGFDASVFVWDIGGRKGTVYELNGHRSKVTCLLYSRSRDLLFSAGEDTTLVSWDMSANRQMTADWAESDICQLCNRPFFWNFKAMHSQKQLGLRQHHCRKCGKAICGSCSTKRSQLPQKGHEFLVRVCEECYIGIKDEEKKSLANFYELKQNVVTMDWDESKKILITVGKDRIVKVWNIKDIL